MDTNIFNSICFITKNNKKLLSILEHYEFKKLLFVSFSME